MNLIDQYSVRLQRLFKWVMRFTAKKVRALRYLWGEYFGQDTFERFAIVGHARTGSNYLVSGLRSSNSIRVYDEIFAAHNREIGKDYEKILSVLFRKQLRSIKVVGFKLFYYHLSEDEWEKFLSNENIKIIHITRKNTLKTIISLDIAFMTGQWHTSLLRSKAQNKKIVIDVNTLLNRLEQIQAYEETARARFKDRPVLEVAYESLVKNPVDEFKRIGAFLNVNDIDPNKIVLKKQNPEKLDELIVNYREVAQLLANTKYANLLVN